MKIKLPEDKVCTRVWTSKDIDICAFVELKDKDDKKFIYSAGYSELGLLGQGDVKESKEFKKLVYASDDLCFVDL